MYGEISPQTLELLRKERVRQFQKFGHEPIANPFQAITIFGEELGEACAALNQAQGEDNFRKEVKQLAACCIAYLDNDLHFGNEP